MKGFVTIITISRTMRTISNPILPGFHPDPSICRVGEDYFLAVSSFEYFPGVPLFHSRDLVNWEPIGHCLTCRSQLDLENIGCSGGIYAPTLRYHNGRFFMVTTNVGKCGNFFVTATDPSGPWSDPVLLAQRGIDPSLLFDDDGTVILTTSQNLQSEIDIATGRLLTEPKQIWSGTGGHDLEAPHLYKIGGWYYLLCAEGGTHHGHMVTISRSKSPWGPFEGCPRNPILTNRHMSGFPVQATGHADLFEAHDGSWWLVCLAVRPGKTFFPRANHLGRETFLAPVEWDGDGWPVVNGNGTLTPEVQGPDFPLHPWPKSPERDDFNRPVLAPTWVHIRNPNPAQYSLSERSGWLRLRGGAATLESREPVACVLRRQTAVVCRAETLLEFAPAQDGEEAGLTVLMNGSYHYCVFVAMQHGKLIAGLRLQVGDITHMRASRELPGPAGSFRLAVEADEKHYRFLACCGDAPLEELGSGLVRHLSTEVAGGFTGVMVGLYATGNGKPSTCPADFAWFDYKAG